MFRNHTLAAMAPADLCALGPHLTERRVEAGTVLTAQGDPVRTVHFPITADLANTVTFSDGGSAEAFITGLEGASGLAPFLADSRCGWSVEVKTAGLVHEIPADRLRERVEASPALRRQLLKLAADYQAQAAMGAACAALHPIGARLARLLLVRFERGATDRLALTQQGLAQLLGCQRTTVSQVAGDLQRAGAVRYSRGVIRVRDAEILRRLACECHALQKELLN